MDHRWHSESSVGFLGAAGIHAKHLVCHANSGKGIEEHDAPNACGKIRIGAFTCSKGCRNKKGGEEKTEHALSLVLVCFEHFKSFVLAVLSKRLDNEAPTRTKSMTSTRWLGHKTI